MGDKQQSFTHISTRKERQNVGQQKKIKKENERKINKKSV